MTPREKAERAKALLNDGMFKLLMADLRESAVHALENLPMTDFETQQEGVRLLQLLQKIPGRLKQYVQDYEIEQKRAEDKSFVERMRQTWRSIP